MTFSSGWSGRSISMPRASSLLLFYRRRLPLDRPTLVLDVPLGPTAKVRTPAAADRLSQGLSAVGDHFGLKTRCIINDGMQPVGRGIGPALEARDVLAVLQDAQETPRDLRERSISLSGALIELAGLTSQGRGAALATRALDDGRAWAKFQRICEAQGGMRVPPVSRQKRPLVADCSGKLQSIDNRKIAQLAKLAGAPDEKAAGVELLVRPGDQITKGAPLCMVHAEAPGELAYAFDYAFSNDDIFSIGES